MTRSKGSIVGSLALPAGLLPAGLLPAGLLPAGDSCRRARDGGQAAKGLRRPADAGIGGRQPDSGRWFDSYPGEDELPSAGRVSERVGCDSPEGGVSRQDFDATLDQLGDVQPWMDWGLKKSARGFARLQKLFHRRYEALAVYRCETGTAEVPIYFPGIDDVGLSGLLTVNIET